MRLWKASALAAACTILLACGGGGGGGAPKNPPSASGPVVYYKVGGSVVGLRGSGLILQIGTGETLAIEADGVFSFPTTIGNFLSYRVSVISQPSQLTQVCTPSNASGVISGADVTNIVINCATSSFPVRANISGLEGSGLRLQLQATDGPTSPAQSVELNQNGEVAFPSALLDGTRYELSVAQQPMSPAQWCVIDHNLPLQHSANAAPVSVTCTSDTYRVGGTVFGLRGSGLVLTNNGTDNLEIAANGAFTFNAPLFDRTSYEVKVSAHPSNMRQTCAVTNSRGSVSGTDVTHVFVNCTATQQLGSAGDDEAHAIGLDATSNLYVAGRTNSNLGDATNAGGWDGFVLKLGVDGDVQWWRQLGSSGDEAINSMAVTPSGDLYVAGATSGELQGSNVGGNDLFVAKYNATGDRQWIRQIGTTAADVAHAVDVAPDGSVYVVGATEGQLVVGSAVGASDIFVAKLDAGGVVQWTRQLGSSESDVALGLDIDAVGTAYIVGGTQGELDGNINPSGEAGFITRYDALGVKQSTHLFCSLNCWFDTPPTWRQSRFNTVAVDASGDAYVGGWTRATDPGEPQPENFGRTNTLTSKFNLGGGFGWVSRSDSEADEEITSVVLAQSDAALYSASTRHQSPTLDSIGSVTHTELSTFTNTMWSVVSSLQEGAEMHSVVSDSLGSSYAVGFAYGSVDDQPHLGGADIVVVRHNAAGEKL